MKVLPFYRDTFFTRLILSYTALVVVLLGLAGGYLYSEANQMMVDEIARDSRIRLVNTKDYIEQTLLRKFEDNLQNKPVSTVFIHNNPDLNYLLDYGWQNNLSRIVSFQQDLAMLMAANEGASNVTVYFRTGNYVVDGYHYYVMPENSPDADFIGRLEDSSLNRWLLRTLPNGNQAVTYAVKVPYNFPNASAKGYMFIDVDLETIKQSAATIMSSPHERLYIFGADGQLLIHTGGANSEEIRLLQEAIESGEKVKEVSDNERSRIILSYQDGSQSRNGWTYAMVRPMNSFVLSSEQFKTKIFAGCGLVLLFGLLISYMFSKRFYIPMKKLVQHIRSLSQPNPILAHANEYAIIGSALNSMGQKIVKLESLAKTNEMKNLVLGASLGLEHMDGLRRDGRYLSAHIKLIDGHSEKFKQRYEHFDHTMQYEFVCLNPKEAAIIYYLDLRADVSEEDIAAELKRVQEEVQEEFRFGAGIGTSVLSPEEIPLSYRVAHQAYRYRFMYGPEAIIPHSKISAFDPKPHLFSLDTFQNTLKAGDVDGANQFIDDFVKILMERNLQLETVELELLKLVSALYETVIELELQQLVPPSNLFDELKKDTLADTISSIRSLSEQIGVHVRDSGKHAQAEVILKLKTYIDKHLHEELSLNVLSEVASLAPAYISTLFGEVMNESFTEYVTRTRLDKAAGLLREDDKLSVTEIAALAGYRNLQYFHVKFKARFGITPVQYRQTKHELNTVNYQDSSSNSLF